MKSGTNTWHGSATWVRHTNFADADNYFSNHNSDNCGSVGECASTPLHNNQFNGTIGGPIVKDKAFLFLYYEGQRYNSLAVSSRTVPTPAEIQGAMANIAASGLTVNPVGQTLLGYFPTSPTGKFIASTPTIANANGFGTKFDYRFNQQHSDNYIVETYTAAGQPDPCRDNQDSSGNFIAGAPLSPFYVPCTGTVGNSRRNQLIGPGLSQLDATIIKNTRITERLNMEFRWELYNVLNRANFFYLPNNTLLGGSLFGITKTPDVASGNPVVAQGGPRNMNFAIKFMF
jgi:hypothetical protein